MNLIVRGLSELKRVADPKTFDKARRMALNTAVNRGKTAASRAVRDVYNITQNKFDGYMKITTHATGERPFVVLRVRSRPLGIIHFGASVSKKKVKTRRGKKVKRQRVSAKILKKKRKRVYPGMFVGTAQTSHSKQVFKRAGRSRLPIFKPAVISPTSMFNKYGREAMEKKFDEVFFKEFDRQFNRLRGV